jgi:hypothetical protein
VIEMADKVHRRIRNVLESMPPTDPVDEKGGPSRVEMEREDVRHNYANQQGKGDPYSGHQANNESGLYGEGKPKEAEMGDYYGDTRKAELHQNDFERARVLGDDISAITDHSNY